MTPTDLAWLLRLPTPVQFDSSTENPEDDVMSSKTLLSLTALATASLLSAACGDDDPLRVDETGVVSAMLIDSPDTQTAAAGDLSTRRFDQVQASFDGSFQGRTLVEVYSPDENAWIAVTGTSTTQLDLGSTDRAELGGSSQIAAGVTYTRVRLTIVGGEAVIQAGASIGGLVVGADVALDLGSGGEVVIEKELSFTVHADVETMLTIDLNSEAWVTEDNVESESVTEDEMESAAQVDAN